MLEHSKSLSVDGPKLGEISATASIFRDAGKGGCIGTSVYRKSIMSAPSHNQRVLRVSLSIGTVLLICGNWVS